MLVGHKEAEQTRQCWFLFFQVKAPILPEKSTHLSLELPRKCTGNFVAWAETVQKSLITTSKGQPETAPLPEPFHSSEEKFP